MFAFSENHSLSPYYILPFSLEAKTWINPRQYVEAYKFQLNREIFNDILNCKTNEEISQTLEKFQKISQFNKDCVNNMRLALNAKVEQFANFKRYLINLYNQHQKFVFHSDDLFWGTNQSKGLNQYGLLVESIVKDILNPPETIIRFSPSIHGRPRHYSISKTN